MGGLVAGTAIQNLNSVSNDLKLVALTINNTCNLHCPHCYLQYSRDNYFIPEESVELVMAQDFEHVAIVGMEPFLDRQTIDRTIKIARRARAFGKSISVITNGLNLKLVQEEDLNLFKFFDVSMDGGASSYQRFRGASYERLMRNIEYLDENDAEINIINTLYSENIAYLDEMLEVTSEVNISTMMFAPYMETSNNGVNFSHKVAWLDLFHQLADSEAFMQNPVANLLLDRYHFLDVQSWHKAHEEVQRLGLGSKVHFVPGTPLSVGSLRVTYDGLILQPAAALHTREYNKFGIPLADVSLGEAYQTFCSQEPELLNSYLCVPISKA